MRDREQCDNIFNFIEADAVFNYSQEIAEYVHENKVDNLILIDRSARPAYVGVSEYYNLKYPGEKKPKFFFINPKGFKTEKNISESKRPVDFMEAVERTQHNDVTEDPLLSMSSAEDVEKDFSERYGDIGKDDSILIVDTCMHKGASMGPIKEFFTEMGFTNFKIMILNTHDIQKNCSVEYDASSPIYSKTCYPLGKDRMVNKTFTRTSSLRNNNEDQIRRGIQLREEIKEIIQEKWKEKEE